LALNVRERFDAKYEPEPISGCWLWTAAMFNDGYGAFRLGKEQRAHRVAYVLANGPIPAGMSVLHRCDTPLCVRPDHLFIGTQADNIRDRDAKGHRASTSGENSGNAKLTNAQAREIKRRAGQTSQRGLAREFGIAESTVSNIVTGKRWSSTLGGEFSGPQS
jgi:Autographiviridae endonuclease